MSRAQALEALSNLGQEIFTPVIENILTDGMSASMNKVLKGKEK